MRFRSRGDYILCISHKITDSISGIRPFRAEYRVNGRGALFVPMSRVGELFSLDFQHLASLFGMVELPRGFSGIYTFSRLMKDTANLSFPEISIVERYCRHFLSIIPFNKISHITCPQSDCVSEDPFNIALCSCGAVRFSMLTCVDRPSNHEYRLWNIAY